MTASLHLFDDPSAFILSRMQQTLCDKKALGPRCGREQSPSNVHVRKHGIYMVHHFCRITEQPKEEKPMNIRQEMEDKARAQERACSFHST